MEMISDLEDCMSALAGVNDLYAQAMGRLSLLRSLGADVPWDFLVELLQHVGVDPSQEIQHKLRNLQAALLYQKQEQEEEDAS